jgi:hypothetical protein
VKKAFEKAISHAPDEFRLANVSVPKRTKLLVCTMRALLGAVFAPCNPRKPAHWGGRDKAGISFTNEQNARLLMRQKERLTKRRSLQVAVANRIASKLALSNGDVLLCQAHHLKQLRIDDTNLLVYAVGTLKTFMGYSGMKTPEVFKAVEPIFQLPDKTTATGKTVAAGIVLPFHAILQRFFSLRAATTCQSHAANAASAEQKRIYKERCAKLDAIQSCIADALLLSLPGLQIDR